MERRANFDACHLRTHLPWHTTNRGCISDPVGHALPLTCSTLASVNLPKEEGTEFLQGNQVGGSRRPRHTLP